MGVTTFLVSDEKREWLDLGKLFFSDEFLESLEDMSKGDVLDALTNYLCNDEDDLNGEMRMDQAAATTATISKWIDTHPDWRFLSEAAEEFYDVYLAENDEDAEEYLEEFGEADGSPIYKKTGDVWKDEK